MKRSIATIALIIITLTAFSQSINRQSAYNELGKGRLDKALAYIEPCITDPSTMGSAKTWYYRGRIYLEIANSQNAKYANLAENPLEKAVESYFKVFELEKDSKNPEFIPMAYQDMQAISSSFYTKAVKEFEAQQFEVAAEDFDNAAGIKELFGGVDTTSIYFGGIAYMNAKKYEEAAKHFESLADMNWHNDLIYYYLYSLNSSSLNNLEKAAKYLNQGLAAYPESLNLLFAAGVENDRKGDFDKAKESYEKVLLIKPDHYDAIYNLGALYVNKAADIQTKANNLPIDQSEEYDNLLNQSKEYLKQALPHLEKAHELMPADHATLITLKDIYGRLQMYEKVKEIDAKIGTTKE